MFYLHWVMKIRALSKSLTVRASAFALIAFIAALISILFSRYVPDNLSEILGGSATRDILDILAKSMLVVVTFSMSTLVATYSMITGSSTPRATKVIMEDSSAHNALSTFLGAFIYSTVSIVSLSTNLYGPKGRVILFGITVIVMTIVIMTIIRWIGRLSNLGHLENLMKEIEAKIQKALKEKNVSMSWKQKDNTSVNNKSFMPFIFNSKVYGYLQTIDLEELEKVANENKFDLMLNVRVGERIGEKSLIAYVNSLTPVKEDLHKKIESCFFIGEMRTFDEDPCYGITALSELASRALSTGVNDPGTAIQVISSITKSILHFKEVEKKEFERVIPKSIDIDEIFDAAYTAISRDGSDNIEVLTSIQKSYLFLSKFDVFEEICSKFSKMTLDRAKNGLSYHEDFKKLESIYAKKSAA